MTMNSLFFFRWAALFLSIYLNNSCGMKLSKICFIKPANMQFCLLRALREGLGQKSDSCKACSTVCIFIPFWTKHSMSVGNSRIISLKYLHTWCPTGRHTPFSQWENISYQENALCYISKNLKRQLHLDLTQIKSSHENFPTESHMKW